MMPSCIKQKYFLALLSHKDTNFKLMDALLHKPEFSLLGSTKLAATAAAGQMQKLRKKKGRLMRRDLAGKT